MCARTAETALMNREAKAQNRLEMSEAGTGGPEMSEDNLEFNKDLLRGAAEIAQFLYGDRGLRRRIFHLVATSKLPVFKLGAMICARKSVLLRWVKEQEERHGGRAAHKAIEKMTN
jgi:hypothetical protein